MEPHLEGDGGARLCRTFVRWDRGIALVASLQGGEVSSRSRGARREVRASIRVEQHACEASVLLET